MQSVPITTNAKGSNPAHAAQARSVTCDRLVVFSGYSGFLHQSTDRRDIIEILLKVALNQINLIPLI